MVMRPPAGKSRARATAWRARFQSGPGFANPGDAVGAGGARPGERHAGAGRRISGAARVDRVELDGQECVPAERVVLMLNKHGAWSRPADERGRDTVYRCLADAALPWLAPIGRLDKASEGFAVFQQRLGWAARISDQDRPRKTYHVQV